MATVDWQELLQAHGDAVRESVRVSLPALVKSYDHAKQTAEVEIAVREPVVDEEGTVATEALPLISDVPVLWLGGGGFHVHLPLGEGDHVLLVFSDLATGVWRSSGQQSDPGDLRRHHLSYCFAIPCVRPDSAPIPGVDGSNAFVVAPSGKTVTVAKSGASSDFVALASKVEDELEAIANAFATFVPGSGGASFPNPYTGGASVGSVTLKSD